MVAPSGASSPAAAGSDGAAAPSALEPGSAVAAVLLSGDMVLSATGTVTWVDGNSVLAFGHPFLSMGPVDMPMARADVLTVLPSLYRSFKFSTTGAVLGSVSQDRSTGILGSFGDAPTMVPMTIRMTSEDLPTQTFHFEVVHNSMLTPILLAMAIDNVLTTLEKRAGERTIVWKSSIQTSDRTVHWDSVFSGLTAKDDAVASLALLTNYLMANEFRDLAIRGVEVEIASLGPAPERAHRPRRGAEGAGPSGRHRAGVGGPRGLPRRPAARRHDREGPGRRAAGTADALRRRRQRGDGLRPLALSARPALARPGPRLPRRACGRRTR